MEITLALLADAANRAESGKLNLLGVFHEIHAATVPCQHPIMALVVELQASALERGTTVKIGVQLIDEDGHTVLALPEQLLAIPVNENTLTPTTNFMFNLVNVHFERYGAYRFEISVDGRLLGNISLAVTSY
jgi:hypothetical protein